VLKNGKRRVTKKSLKEEHPLTKEYLLRFSEEHPEVLKEYKAHLSSKNRPLNNGELELLIGAIKDHRPVISTSNQEETGVTNQHNTVQGDNVAARSAAAQ